MNNIDTKNLTVKIDSEGIICGIDVNKVIAREKAHNAGKSIRDNLALMYFGQKLVDLKFKGMKTINGSFVEFTEDGVFVFTMAEVVYYRTSSLKEMTNFLKQLLQEG